MKRILAAALLGAAAFLSACGTREPIAEGTVVSVQEIVQSEERDDSGRYYEPPMVPEVAWKVDVPAGTELSRFTLDASDDAADLDLFVYKLKDGDDSVATAVWQSASQAADEQVTLVKPAAGRYLVVANMYAPTSGMVWDLWSGSVPTAAATGGFAASPNPLTVTQGTKVSYNLAWTGLDPAGRYLGVVQYGTSAVRTIVTVD